MLPPVGWADVATKTDLSMLKTDLLAVEAKLEGRIDRVEARIDARLERELRAGQTRYVTWLLASQAAIVGVVGVATSVLIVVLG